MQILSKGINKKKLFLTLILFTIIILIIVSPQKYIYVSFNAIEVWAKILLPSLFPFFVFTKLLSSLGYIENISSIFSTLTYKLYKTKPISSYVFFMSILTGYPVGSKLIYDLYKDKKLSKKDATKCITFCSNSGPMFIVGSVGIGMLSNKTCGYIILISHIIGALINGVVYRNIKDTKRIDIPYNNTLDKKQKNTTDLIIDSINSILLICGIIVISFIIIEALNSLNIFYPLELFLNKLGINSELFNCLKNGFFEMTKGCLNATSLSLNIRLKTILICSIITFGGISTHMQAMSFLQNIISYKFFILQKTTHTIFSIIICAVLSFLFL